MKLFCVYNIFYLLFVFDDEKLYFKLCEKMKIIKCIVLKLNKQITSVNAIYQSYKYKIF